MAGTERSAIGIEERRKFQEVENAWFINGELCLENPLSKKVEADTIEAISDRLLTGDAVVIATNKPQSWTSFNLARPLAAKLGHDQEVLKRLFLIAKEGHKRPINSYGAGKWNITLSDSPIGKIDTNYAQKLLKFRRIKPQTFNFITAKEADLDSADALMGQDNTQRFYVGIFEQIRDGVEYPSFFDRGTRIALGPSLPESHPIVGSVQDIHIKKSKNESPQN